VLLTWSNEIKCETWILGQVITLHFYCVSHNKKPFTKPRRTTYLIVEISLRTGVFDLICSLKSQKPQRSVDRTEHLWYETICEREKGYIFWWSYVTVSGQQAMINSALTGDKTAKLQVLSIIKAVPQSSFSVSKFNLASQMHLVNWEARVTSFQHYRPPSHTCQDSDTFYRTLHGPCIQEPGSIHFCPCTSSLHRWSESEQKRLL
jgi:hypothetical protein